MNDIIENKDYVRLDDVTAKMQLQFKKLVETGKLFRSAMTGREVWEQYLSSFTKEANPVFRDPNSSYMNCNHCNNFIRRYGNVISIDGNGKIMTLFDIKNIGDYQNSFDNLDKKLKSTSVSDVFFETYELLNSLPYEKCNKNQEVFRLGIKSNSKTYSREEAQKFGVVKQHETRNFNHFYLDLSNKFVNTSGKSIESISAYYRDKYGVFKRAVAEIPLDVLFMVKDLINQGSLLDGTTHLNSIDAFIKQKEKFELNKDNKNHDNLLWLFTYDLEERIAKFKNTLIGVLCSEIAEGIELEVACNNWNKRVDPVNYMKATSPITKKQIDEAKKFVQENGYEDSFSRRFAIGKDIRVSEILHSNVGDGEVKSISVFDNVKASSNNKKPKDFKNVESVSIDKFMKDILPTCDSVELYLENRMQGNLVTLTTSKVEGSKPMFKWDNNYSWTYKGNLAGTSLIKEAVKGRGGNVVGVLNIRLHFPDTTNDYDLHMVEPNYNHIYYGNLGNSQRSSGMLDLDAQGISGSFTPDKRVENITYTDLDKMHDGDYQVYVNNYGKNRFPANFTIEIESGDDVTVLNFPNFKSYGGGGSVDVAMITVKNNEIKVNPASEMVIVSSNTITNNIWGIDTNEFHRVNLVCLSPNHWGDNSVGNKHYMFMLDDCNATENIRSFHNENLTPDLLKHKKVMEVLGASNMLEPSGGQLSGVGFNSTIKNEVTLKCSGSFNRVIKVKF